MTEPLPQLFISRQRVRFDQLDALGMLHNAQYLVLFERARTDFWLANGYFMDERTADWPYYVRRNEVNYYRAVYAETDVCVTVTVEKLGTTSVTLGHTLLGEDGTLIADGQCVLVRVDKKTKRPISWSDWFRNQFAAKGPPSG